MRPRSALLAAAMPVALLACAPEPETVGKTLYLDHCTACHGTSGRGDGPAATDLDRRVPDLTLIAQRNGGVFPTARVMSVIDGYTRVRAGNATMPEFGAELQTGPLVMLDSGDARPVPTPSRLVALAAYLETIQR